MQAQNIIDRFFSYITIDTQSDPNSDTTPSTEKQWELARLLVEELKRIEKHESCEIPALAGYGKRVVPPSSLQPSNRLTCCSNSFVSCREENL